MPVPCEASAVEVVRAKVCVIRLIKGLTETRNLQGTVGCSSPLRVSPHSRRGMEYLRLRLFRSTEETNLMHYIIMHHIHVHANKPRGDPVCSVMVSPTVDEPSATWSTVALRAVTTFPHVPTYTLRHFHLSVSTPQRYFMLLALPFNFLFTEQHPWPSARKASWHKSLADCLR